MINGVPSEQLVEAFSALTPILQKTLFRVLHQANPNLFDELVAYQETLDPIDENEVIAIVEEAFNQNLNITRAHMEALNELGELFGVALFAFQANEENDNVEDVGARSRARLR
jgi:hypothetical protein